MKDDVRREVESLATKAKRASVDMAKTTLQERNCALQEMAAALKARADEIIAANKTDVELAKAKGVKESLIDRLMLDSSRIEGMADALEDLMKLPDPLGKVLFKDEMYNGIELEKVSVALGVVAVIYEARPNVTADAAGIALKSGNACVLRGGSLAQNSNVVISDILCEAAVKAGMPDGCIVSIASADRAAGDVLMELHGTIDVLIPRGGSGLINHCVSNSKVPVIETGTGNCHVYVHDSADAQMAIEVVRNAKCRRYGVCNACETLLLDEGVSDDVSSDILRVLADEGVLIHADERAYDLALVSGVGTDLLCQADESDWETEYLAPEIAVRFVKGADEAIDHINKYGTKHSESIVANDSNVANRFLREVDAAAVYHNASTAFTDGGQFGLGAEIGISTQKLHVRGPFALEGLTSYKYIARGNGQIRD